MAKYWFPRKRYGWGWGVPSAWQGWWVLAIFAMLVAIGAVLLLVLLLLPPLLLMMMSRPVRRAILVIRCS